MTSVVGDSPRRRAPGQRASRPGTVITSLRLVDFKNFADETLRVGPFTVIVGANASGKSNVRDAFRFLHGVGRGYTLAEILGGRWGPGGQAEWRPVRGAPNEVARVAGVDPGPRFALEVELRLDDAQSRTACGSRLFPDRPFQVTAARTCPPCCGKSAPIRNGGPR